MIEPLAAAWRIAFLTLAAPVMGSVLMTAIARLTGARWAALSPVARFAPLLALAALFGLAQVADRPPEHLELWLSWWAVGLRGLVAGALFAWAAARLASGAGETFAGVTLALYAALVTPIASDWMLGQNPGHPVSAIGMMLFVESIGGAAALALALGRGPLPFRRDMARLLVAAALGLAYLAFMDFLIIWFGNLPSRVGFYVARGTPGMAALAAVALTAGVAAPIALLTLIEGERGRRLAGMSGLAGLLLFNSWWVAGGVAGSVLAALIVAAAAAGLAPRTRSEAPAHG